MGRADLLGMVVPSSLPDHEAFRQGCCLGFLRERERCSLADGEPGSNAVPVAVEVMKPKFLFRLSGSG